MNTSQEDLAKMIGISYATVNRWENGHSQPNKAAQLRLYDICKERNVEYEAKNDNDLADTIVHRINEMLNEDGLVWGK